MFGYFLNWPFFVWMCVNDFSSTMNSCLSLSCSQSSRFIFQFWFVCGSMRTNCLSSDCRKRRWTEMHEGISENCALFIIWHSNTVKASNFAPQENFAFYLLTRLANIKRVLHENKGNGRLRKTSDIQTWSDSYFVPDPSKRATDFARK